MMLIMFYFFYQIIGPIIASDLLSSPPSEVLGEAPPLSTDDLARHVRGQNLEAGPAGEFFKSCAQTLQDFPLSYCPKKTNGRLLAMFPGD